LFIISSESRKLSTTCKWLSPPVGVPAIKPEIERIFRQLDQLRPHPRSDDGSPRGGMMTDGDLASEFGRFAGEIRMRSKAIPSPWSISPIAASL